MTDTREEIIEAAREAVVFAACQFGDTNKARETHEMLGRRLDEFQSAILEASPLERYRAALEEIRGRVVIHSSDYARDVYLITERALRPADEPA